MRVALSTIVGALGIGCFAAGFALTIWPLFGGPFEAVILGAFGLPLTFVFISAAEKIHPSR